MIMSLVAPRRREASPLSGEHSIDISTWQPSRLCMRHYAYYGNASSHAAVAYDRRADEWSGADEKINAGSSLQSTMISMRQGNHVARARFRACGKSLMAVSRSADMP
jgi:hypothetical protein